MTMIMTMRAAAMGYILVEIVLVEAARFS